MFVPDHYNPFNAQIPNFLSVVFVKKPFFDKKNPPFLSRFSTFMSKNMGYYNNSGFISCYALVREIFLYNVS